MKEDFLHYVWMYKLFQKENLASTKGETIHVIKSGTYNTNAGPDFLNASIEIDNQTWVGNVEIHLKSSDWYLHHHENDANYDATILHVVYEHDMEVFLKENQILPTLVLKNLIAPNLLHQYQKLVNSHSTWIPCGDQIQQVDAFTFSNWKERLFFERLERKSLLIQQLLKDQNNDFEAVLFQLLAKNFGLKVNGDAFLLLSRSMDFSVIRKVRTEETQLMALLFGQAGFLEEDLQEPEHIRLKKEYAYLQHKYNLQSISKHQFSFFRMRPNNFPTIRIAQLVSVYHLHQNLFSKLMQITRIEDFYAFFSVAISVFWQHHYTFETTSKKTPKKLTKPFVDLLLINTIIPLKFVFEKQRGIVNEVSILQILYQIPPEKNSIISKFEELGISSQSAFDTQALLELKNSYCASKGCLGCAIGNRILKKG